MMDFAGEVYDGPLQGEWIVKERSWFVAASALYTWSRSLHKWVFYGARIEL